MAVCFVGVLVNFCKFYVEEVTLITSATGLCNFSNRRGKQQLGLHRIHITPKALMLYGIDWALPIPFMVQLVFASLVYLYHTFFSPPIRFIRHSEHLVHVGVVRSIMEDFSTRLLETLNNGMLSVGLVMGHELKLFDALASVSSENEPATCTTIAKKSNMRERYVREWLCLMACGKIIEVDESGEKFWIRENRVGDLCGDKPNVLLFIQRFVVMCAKAYPTVIELFRNDGPLEVDSSMFDEFNKTVESISEVAYTEDIVTKFVSVTRMQDKLEEGGIQILDVHCGRGTRIAELGSHYPKCFFTGIDLSLEAVVGASKKRDEANTGLDNVSYMQMDGQMMKDEWTEKFDWVIMFNTFHDQMKLDRCLKEIYRVLKPDGLFSMIETGGTGNAYKDKEMNISTYMYGMSVSHSLPVGMNSEGAVRVGAMWGQEKAKQLLTNAGFEKVEIRPNPFSRFLFNIIYVCHK
ncbi:unnamed protein product [Litomosoides sigmodontis]|uniref:Uncharacterized protein n=1 Tax=Litomosoides sigmodontis TaxID=42156 RepID=A0A3P6TQU9_LITSI|nr:unnamed protein product [Litomosoides sigmodontis]